MTGAPTVVAVAIVRNRGDVLVTRRPAGSHLEGMWEFPGGKTEPGESAFDCARRETFEETGLRVVASSTLDTREHVYPDRTVRIDFVECKVEGGTIDPTLQGARWVSLEQLSVLTMPAANAEIVRRLLESIQTSGAGTD
ncbi:MAG: (deoxy)nucleoside triphosphate pyrophosphohydrolase [Chloroflexi bacterium]|nr:(deoxy)nucleoside triphosphate pyrophosphohydrolase [Chloroflexota bacterium]